MDLPLLPLLESGAGSVAVALLPSQPVAVAPVLPLSTSDSHDMALRVHNAFVVSPVGSVLPSQEALQIAVFSAPSLAVVQN